LNSDQGALNKTLDSVFNNPDSTTGWILYNDERPGDVPGTDNGALGHTKGVLAFDTATKTGYPALARIHQSRPLLSDDDLYIKVKRMFISRIGQTSKLDGIIAQHSRSSSDASVFGDDNSKLKPERNRTRNRPV
jgi:hypothetical protein